MERQIGKGSCGHVHLARWNETPVAVKVLHSTFTSSAMEEEQDPITYAHMLEQLDKVRWCLLGSACRVLMLSCLCILGLACKEMVCASVYMFCLGIELAQCLASSLASKGQLLQMRPPRHKQAPRAAHLVFLRRLHWECTAFPACYKQSKAIFCAVARCSGNESYTPPVARRRLA